MIYNFNQGIGWASSGVEFAQAYRASVLRTLGEEAKYIFTDKFPRENIERFTSNMGFPDEDIIWLYQYFTDVKIAPPGFTVKDLEATIAHRAYTKRVEKNAVRYIFEDGKNCFLAAFLHDMDGEYVHHVEVVENGRMIRKDIYTYCRLYSEFYAPLNDIAHLYMRRFYNEDGSTAYEEIIDASNTDEVMFKFPDRIIDSKIELIGYMFEKFDLTEDDIVLVDRNDQFGQAVLRNRGKAKVGLMIHADHFNDGNTDDDNILWNNFYEYAFDMYKHIDFYVCATEAQKKLLEEQFRKYKNAEVKIYAIPVGALPELKKPTEPRKPFSLITASRLATEKHIDWLIEAVAEAHKEIPEVTLDICGEGGQREHLKKTIEECEAQDYIHMLGHQKLDEMYKQYEAYVSGSTSEGFGLTLMEAVGSGLPIIGFDVRYGNQTFIDHEKNGYLIDEKDNMSRRDRVNELKTCIVRLFKEADLEAFHERAYEVAEKYLQKEVELRWQKALLENRQK